MSLQIDYEDVKTRVANVKNRISNSSVEADYNALISEFAESKGDQATAIRSLLKAEKQMTKQANKIVKRLADSIQSAARQFGALDSNTSKDMREK